VNDHQYYQSLPRKRVGAGAIFLNSNNKILLVKPNYRKGWLLPGGAVEAEESPLSACVREAREEVGLVVTEGKLLLVEYDGEVEGYRGDCLRFIFFGGVLTREHESCIELQKDELDEFAFVSLDEAIELGNIGLQRRLPEAMKALRDGTTIYLEH
jgi:8-oxo-dGTP diphosphatase